MYLRETLAVGGPSGKESGWGVWVGVEIRGGCGVARWQKCDGVHRNSRGLAGVSGAIY